MGERGAGSKCAWGWGQLPRQGGACGPLPPESLNKRPLSCLSELPLEEVTELALVSLGLVGVQRLPCFLSTSDAGNI